jgi:hypothetical protein
MGDANMQAYQESLKEMGLEDPNFDGKLNDDDAAQHQEVIEVELADINFDEDTQRQRERMRSRRAQARERSRRKKT